jgi:hypothetical protein
LRGFDIVNKTYVYSLSFLSALFSFTSSIVAPVTQYITKLTRNIINQKPIVATVRKAIKPKYWENSISDRFEFCTKYKANIYSSQKPEAKKHKKLFGKSFLIPVHIA